MNEIPPQALGTSLVRARLGVAAVTPPSEQQLVARLQTAASRIGCRTPDVITALYVGLKLHLRVCLYGAARQQTVLLLDAIAATMIGSDSEQMLHLRGPIGADAMLQRFAAIRIGEFVSTVLEPTAQGKAWFLLIDTPGDPTSLLKWVEREVAATMQARGLPGGTLPQNLFVLVAAGEQPAAPQRCWLTLEAPEWFDQPAQIVVQPLPPVGYQRQLLDYQLTGKVYRLRLRAHRSQAVQWLTPQRLGLAPSMIGRWLAASIDAQQQGLWMPTDLQQNTRRALAVLTLRRTHAGEPYRAAS